MKKTSKIIWLIFSFFVIALGLTYFLYSRDVREEKIKISEATAADNVYGWAWGANFGWISLNCLNDFDGDGGITLPGDNHCSSVPYGVNIGPSGIFDDDSYAWSNNLGWLDFAPSTSVGIDPFGVPTIDSKLNEDGTINGWGRSVQNLWGNPHCHSWIRMRGNKITEADFEKECVAGVNAGKDCMVDSDCPGSICKESYVWNDNTKNFTGDFPYCVSCNYYNRYCSDSNNACMSDGDCPDGVCGDYVMAPSTENGVTYRCDVCYTDYDVLVTSVGAGALCVKENNQNMCSDCINNGDVTPDTCTSCPRCYEYGVAIDKNKNRLTGWAWGTLHKEEGHGTCGSNIGVGWLAFHVRDRGIFAPWMESVYGSIYSVGSVGSENSFHPPSGKYNATYAIHSGGIITNFYSASGSQWEKQDYNEEVIFPNASQNYSSILGKIDFAGLQAGIYGPVEIIEDASDIASILGGKVYIYDGEDDLIISDPITFSDGTNGAGTIIVRGNLNIEDDITYNTEPVSKLKALPSVAFIVLGDLTIDPSVTNLVGAYIVLGDGGTEKCKKLDSPSDACGRFSTGFSTSKNLTVSGLVMAKQFHLQRLFMSLDEGAERFIYDGRLLANTPPGLQDITQALPQWNEIAP